MEKLPFLPLQGSQKDFDLLGPIFAQIQSVLAYFDPLEKEISTFYDAFILRVSNHQKKPSCLPLQATKQSFGVLGPSLVQFWSKLIPFLAYFVTLKKKFRFFMENSNSGLQIIRKCHCVCLSRPVNKVWAFWVQFWSKFIHFGPFLILQRKISIFLEYSNSGTQTNRKSHLVCLSRPFIRILAFVANFGPLRAKISQIGWGTPTFY